MGTLSENQTQEHNEEEDRPRREDLGAGAAGEENAREAQGRSEAEGTLDLCGGSGPCPGLGAPARAGPCLAGQASGARGRLRPPQSRPPATAEPRAALTAEL